MQLDYTKRNKFSTHLNQQWLIDFFDCVYKNIYKKSLDTSIIDLNITSYLVKMSSQILTPLE